MATNRKRTAVSNRLDVCGLFPESISCIGSSYCKSEQEIVANNPTVCIMQAGWSISLVAWLLHPLIGYSNGGLGLVLTHVFFFVSTTIDILTWIAIWQRRKSLIAIGADPAWAGVSFPFVSSAIAANLYHEAFSRYYNVYFQYMLLGSVWLLTLLSTFLDIVLICCSY